MCIGCRRMFEGIYQNLPDCDLRLLTSSCATCDSVIAVWEFANSSEPLQPSAASFVNRHFFDSRHSCLVVSMTKLVERLLEENRFLDVIFSGVTRVE